MTLYQILSLLGVGSIAASAIAVAFKQIRSVRLGVQSVRLGVQALLRAQLTADWNYYSKEGYAPIYARENFENAYTQYHNLGANGVMDDIHAKFLALPDRKDSDTP